MFRVAVQTDFRNGMQQKHVFMMDFIKGYLTYSPNRALYE